MTQKRFIHTFSDDILCVEEAYRTYLKYNPQIESIIWPSLCRVYILIAVSCADYFMEYVLEKAGIPKVKDAKQNIETIVKTALKRNSLPTELQIPKKIRNYVCLRELRHFIVHTDLKGQRETKIKSIGLHLDVELFTEKEFNRIKQIVGDVINLIGISMVVIENPQLSQHTQAK